MLLTGSLTSLNVFNVISASAGFAISESTVSPTMALANSTLITVGLDNLSATAGAGGFGVSITGGDLGIAVLEPANPAMAGFQADIAVTGTDLAGALALGNSVSASVSGLAVGVNETEDSSGNWSIANALNWNTTFSPAIDPVAEFRPRRLGVAADHLRDGRAVAQWLARKLERLWRDHRLGGFRAQRVDS